MKVTVNKHNKNIFKEKTLVYSPETERIVLVTETSDVKSNVFSGIEIRPSIKVVYCSPKLYSKEWSKERFDLFFGSVTLEND